VSHITAHLSSSANIEYLCRVQDLKYSRSRKAPLKNCILTIWRLKSIKIILKMPVHISQSRTFISTAKTTENNLY